VETGSIHSHRDRWRLTVELGMPSDAESSGGSHSVGVGRKYAGSIPFKGGLSSKTPRPENGPYTLFASETLMSAEAYCEHLTRYCP
jgi:hypothetical protein